MYLSEGQDKPAFLLSSSVGVNGMILAIFYAFVSCDLIGLLDFTESWTWTLHLEVSVCFYSKPADETFLDPTEHVR